MGKIVQKMRFDLKEYDSDWKDSFIMVAAKGFTESMDFQRKIGKLEREGILIERDLKKVQSKLDGDATFGADSDDDLKKEEASLVKKLDKISEQIASIFLKINTDQFLSGYIYDSDEKKERNMVKEDIEMFSQSLQKEIAQLALGIVPKKD